MNTRFTATVPTKETAERVERVHPGAIQGRLEVAGRSLEVLKVDERTYVAERRPTAEWALHAKMNNLRIVGVELWPERATESA